MRFKHRPVYVTALLVAIPFCLVIIIFSRQQQLAEAQGEQLTNQLASLYQAKPANQNAPAGEEDAEGFGNASDEIVSEESTMPEDVAGPGSFGSGFGSGAFGSGQDGFAGGFPPGAGGMLTNERLIQGTHIMISWSKNHDELRGFSQKSGEWTNLKIEKQEKLNPIVGLDVAAVRVGESMAAYSGLTGTWDVLKLSKDSNARAVVSTNWIQTADNDYLYTFAAAKGKWTSPNDPKFRPSENDYRSSLPPGTTPAGGPSTESMMMEMTTGYESEYRDSIRTQVNQLNAEAAQLAEKYRGKGLDDEEARQVLTKVVELAFDQRQRQQSAEAQRLAEKLKQIQEAIEKRKALRDRIIQRRVEELLDPNVEWGKAFPGGASNPSPSGVSGTPLSSSLSPPARKHARPPVIQKLRTEQVEVDLDLVDDAPVESFEQGKCLVIAGLLQSAATQSLHDFELQRQEFTAAPTSDMLDNTPWTQFDLKKSIEVLQNSKGFAADRLPVELAHPVITEPLPRLKSGEWPEAVVHPDLRNSLNQPPGDTIQFRVFDFEVKPNHHYRYRVRLAVEVAGRQTWCDWSNPTNSTEIIAASAAGLPAGAARAGNSLP